MFGGKPQLWSAGRDPWELSQAGSVPLPFCWCLLTWQLPLLCRAMVPSGTAHPSPKTTRLWTAMSAQDTMPTWNTAFFPLLLVSSQWSSKDGFSWIILVSPSTPFFFHIFILVLILDPAMGENELKLPQHSRSPSLSFSPSIFILLRFILWTRTCQ